MSQEEEMKMLQREANEAKGNARMLVETLAFTPDEGVGENELVAVSHFCCCSCCCWFCCCFFYKEAVEIDWNVVREEKRRLTCGCFWDSLID